MALKGTCLVGSGRLGLVSCHCPKPLRTLFQHFFVRSRAVFGRCRRVSGRAEALSSRLQLLGAVTITGSGRGFHSEPRGSQVLFHVIRLDAELLDPHLQFLKVQQYSAKVSKRAQCGKYIDFAVGA